MVRHPAYVAGTGIGAKRLAPGVAAIGRLQKRNGDDFHAVCLHFRAHKKQVDEFPRTVVLDGAKALLVQRLREVP